MGRKVSGFEKKQARSIRIEPSAKAKVERQYGSLQKWIDKKLFEEFGKQKAENRKEEIRPEDF